MSKCILLSRVSSIMQTLEQQTNELINEAHHLGYSDSDMIIIENHESAIKLDEVNRIGIQRMYNTIENNPSVDCVICYEVSRLSRRAKDLYSIRDFLIDRKIQLIILKPYLRLLDIDGKMSQAAAIMFSLFSSLSESEMMMKRERMMRGKNQKKIECKYIGGHIAIGYRRDENNNIVIDEEKALIIKQCFNMCENGESTYSIGRYMFDHGLIDGENIETINTKVDHILRNEAYTGNGSCTYPYPQIISKEQFERCREIRRQHRKPKSKVIFEYYGRGLIFNKKNMRALTPSHANNVYASYCYNTKDTVSVNINLMDSVIWQVIVDHSLSYGIEKRLQHLLASHDDVVKRINVFEKKKSTYTDQIDRVQRRIVEGKLNETRGDIMLDEIYSALQLLDIKKDDLMHVETNLMNEITYVQSFMYNENACDELYITNDDAERRKICVAEIDKILVERTEDNARNIKCDIIFKDGHERHLMLRSPNRHQSVLDENNQLYNVNIMKRIIRKRK